MDRKDIEKRVRLWEAEGYDVSELKAKWFSKGGGGRSPAWIVLSVVAAIVALLFLSSGWSPWSPGQAPIVPHRDPAMCTLVTAITPSGSGSVSPSSGTYDAGTRVTLTASPASGYQFSHWSGDAGGDQNPVTIASDKHMNVVANFVRQYTLSTAVSPSGSGSVSPSSGTHDAGTKATLTATPASGYQFGHWSGDGSGTNPTIELTMNSDKHVVASFTEQAVHLSKLQPYSVQYVHSIAYDVDANIVMGGKRYYNGIKVGGEYRFGTPTVFFNLDGAYSRLTGLVGFDDSVLRTYFDDDILFYGDGNLLAAVNLKAGDLPKPVDIDVTGVTALRIEFYYPQPRGIVTYFNLANMILEP